MWSTPLYRAIWAYMGVLPYRAQRLIISWDTDLEGLKRFAVAGNGWGAVNHSPGSTSALVALAGH